MLDTTSVNTGIHKGVTIQCSCLEKAFGSFLELTKTDVVNLAFSIQLHQDVCANAYEVAQLNSTGANQGLV